MIGDIIDAVRELGPDVHSVSVTLREDGSASLLIQATDEDSAISIADSLRLEPPIWVDNGSNEWLRSERRDGQMSVTVIGAHRSLCQVCAARRAA